MRDGVEGDCSVSHFQVDFTHNPDSFPRNFGTQVVPPPPILKALPKIFAHSDKTVRAEGTALALNVYQYIGPGIEPWLNDLKPVQVKELKEAFEGLERDGKGKGTIKAERLTRALAREAELHADDGEEAVEEAPEGEVHPSWSLGCTTKLAQSPRYSTQEPLLNPKTLYPNYPPTFKPTSSRLNGKTARRPLTTLLYCLMLPRG